MADFIDDDAIIQFVNVTGADPDQAQSYLQVADGNVDTAVNLFFTNGGAPLMSEQPPRPAAPSMVDEEGYREKIAPKKAVLIGGDDDDDDRYYGGPMPPFHHARHGGPSAGAPLPVDPFRNYEAEGQFVRNLRAQGRGEGAEAEKAKKLADIFRPPFEIMFQGGFDNAKLVAREQKKFLMVSVNKTDEFASHVMNRDLFSQQSVKDFIKEHFVFILWGADSTEGQQHAVRYPIQGYPYLAIIDPLTGERVKQWNVVPSVPEFLQEASEVLEGHIETKPNQPKKKKAITELSEEEQLELALAASVESNGGIAIDNDDDEDTAQDDEEDILKNSEVEKPVDVLAVLLPVKRPEPTADAARIQFRLPDGGRVIHKFNKTDPVRFLFEFVKAEVPETQSRPFDLIAVREPLLPRLNETILDAGVAAASLSVVFTD
ncbi:hypothetical protein HK097_001946 [Rhizophlyctis rosea]|uniref:UBX domain-containing protein n=1 Tax=Rhizophlyctis rosea TaxID=64517 RepID=A0AAD5SJ22_9FUNG|nr:hypothetical protein HK097_001946 [Rhizophlyctis rosea]